MMMYDDINQEKIKRKHNKTWNTKEHKFTFA